MEIIGLIIDYKNNGRSVHKKLVKFILFRSETRTTSRRQRALGSIKSSRLNYGRVE